MHTMRSVLGVLRAVVPVVYCGGLVYFFYDQAGSIEQVKAEGLGPTLLGLGVVGLLLCIPLMVSIVRLIAGRRPPGSDGRGGPGTPNGDDDSGFDADAVVARYMAQRSAEAVAGPSAAPPARSGQTGSRPGFGRKIR